jgi:cytochrome c-type biogenesis protein CcmE
MTTTGIKLAVGGVVVAAATGYMAYLGASTSWQYYLTVDECLDSAADVGNSRLRVHGKVAPGSLAVAADRTRAVFRLTGQRGSLDVVCNGPLPDNLKEGIDVVVEGRLESATSLHGDRVLTKCASKYQTASGERR